MKRKAVKATAKNGKETEREKKTQQRDIIIGNEKAQTSEIRR